MQSAQGVAMLWLAAHQDIWYMKTFGGILYWFFSQRLQRAKRD